MATWNIDSAHTEANFAVKHMMFATVRGSFGGVEGTINYDPDMLNESSVSVTIDANTVSTGVADRDAHLRSADFFNVEKYPTITFNSTSFKATDENNGVLIGDLTIAGVTKSVEITVSKLGTGTDPWGNQRAGFNGETKINREDFGLTWNQALEAGGVLVGKDISIELNVQAVLVTTTESA